MHPPQAMQVRADELAAQLRSYGRPGWETREWDFPTAMQRIGVAVGPMRALGKETAQALKDAPPGDILALAEALIATGLFEGRLLAYEIVAFHKPTMASLNGASLKRLGQGNDNWATVDSFACQIAGIVWLRGQVPDSVILNWATSKDLWWRRTALASTTPLNKKTKGGRGDTRRTLLICEPCIADRNETIVKALSWALRCLVPWDRGAVEAFLARHDTELAALVKREVRRKLDTGAKNRKKA